MCRVLWPMANKGLGHERSQQDSTELQHQGLNIRNSPSAALPRRRLQRASRHW